MKIERERKRGRAEVELRVGKLKMERPQAEMRSQEK